MNQKQEEKIMVEEINNIMNEIRLMVTKKLSKTKYGIERRMLYKKLLEVRNKYPQYDSMLVNCFESWLPE